MMNQYKKLKANYYRKRIMFLRSQEGFSVLEVILAAALFTLFSIGIVAVVLQGFDANRLGSEETIANQYASEGIEAIRSIKNQSFSNLIVTSSTGLIRNGSNVWAFGGLNNTFGKYTRVASISAVQRDGSGNIVLSGGTIDPNTMKAMSTVSWNVSPTRNDSVVLSAYLTNWRATISNDRNGMLVFGDGATTADTMRYQTFDESTKTWSGTAGTNTVTLDTANLSSQLITTSSATFSWNHTVGSQNSKLLVVQVSTSSSTNAVVGVITYHGQAMTQLKAQSCSTNCRDEVWYLLNPPQGTFPISVRQTSSAAISGTAETFYNVNQSTPFDNGGTATTTTATGTTLSLSVPSATSDLIADWYSNQATACNTFTLSTGQTKQIGTCNTVAQDTEASTKAGAASTTSMSWTWTTSQQAADIGIGIKPSSSTTFSATADVDTGSTNKAVRALRVYASSTRNEKMLISRHYDGTSQYIYAQVFNGSTWGNVVQLSTWTASTFLDVQNFDGAYLSDGTFMVVYSDNTVIPKYRIWNGTTWAAQGSLTTLGASQIPSYIVTSARPGTSEVMAAFFTQGSSTISEYYNSTWSAITTHAAAAPLNTEKMVDFVWSPNNATKGGLVFSNNANDKQLHIKIFTADGSGSGSWSAVGSSTSVSHGIGALTIVGRAGADEFQACYKNDATNNILCYKSDFTPTVTDPTNVTITTTTDAGIQKSYDLNFETILGDPAIIVYSDSTSVPKFKKFTASTATWDVSASSITTTGSPGIFKSVRVIPQNQGNDMLILMADANLAIYSIFWNGSGSMYTTPADKAFTVHGTNGSATTDLWYDFAWDKF